MLKNLRSLSTLLAINTMLVLAVPGLLIGVDAIAQTPAGAHGKTTGIPEKKSDGTWESLKAGQQKNKRHKRKSMHCAKLRPNDKLDRTVSPMN